MTTSAQTDEIELFPKWLLRSKVYPTQQQIHILDRPALMRKLDDCLNKRLSLIHAPAGYGKSTLISSWRELLQNNGVKVCWLSLDREDNEVFQLLTYIAYCLSEGGVDLHSLAAEEESYLTKLSARSLLSILTQVIAKESGRVVLVLDDFENLERKTIDAVITPLLRYAPENLHTVIASRNDLDLAISDMEARGLAARIGATELKLSENESAALFSCRIAEPLLKQLYALTEGWPVAVQMVRSAASDERELGAIISQIKGNRGTVAAYLSEQVFNNLDQEQQHFLMDVSVLDRVDCHFVDYLRDRQDSLQLFNDIRQLNSLVLPLDRIATTYRLHPLFRDYLYDKLAVGDPQRRIQLHLRTADWFSDRGDLVNAVRHCVKAGFAQRAGVIIQEAGGLVLWLKEGLSRLRAAHDLLDDSTVFASPRLTLIRCLLEVKDGKVHQARSHYDAVRWQTESADGQRDGHQQTQLEHELMLLEFTLALYEGKQIPDASCQELIQKISGIDSNEHTTLSHHYTLLCLALVQRGMFKDARQYAEKAIPQFRQIKSLYGEVYIYFHLGDICFAEGKSAQAEKHYRASLEIGRRHFNDDGSMRMVAYVLLSELKYELNQIGSLPKFVESIPKQLEKREAWFDIYAAGYTTASNLEFHKYGLNAALGILDRASAYAEEQQLSRLIDLLLCQRMELLLRAGKDVQADAILQHSSIELDTYKDPSQKDFAWRERDAAVHVITRLLIRQSKYDEALAALAHFAAHAKRYGHVRSCIKYSILQSIAHYGKGDIDSCYSQLDDALALSQKSGFIRSFIDEGKEIKQLLQVYLSASDAAAANINTIKAVLEHFDETGIEEAQTLLSKREMQVLLQLGQGHSNKVIARNIDISENTVRFHLKNIFNKLHVDSRLQAVAVARKQNFIRG